MGMNAEPLGHVAMRRLGLALLVSCLPWISWAQTPWPAWQVEMYPYVESMVQTRPEQTILLGEGDLQTGIFYASVAEVYSEEVQTALIEDAEEKGWRLRSVLRLGTSYVMTLTKNDRTLDLRLTNTVRGVDAVYSVLMSQQPKRP